MTGVMKTKAPQALALVALAAGLVALLAGPALADPHSAFVKVESRDVSTGQRADGTGRDATPRPEWIRCARVSFGASRDVATGGRSHGHRQYDRIELVVEPGALRLIAEPGKPRRPVRVTLAYFEKPKPAGDAELKVEANGTITRTEVVGGRLHVTVTLQDALEATAAARGLSLSETLIDWASETAP